MNNWSKEKKIFAFFFILYCLFANYDSWNENSRLDLTRAIVDKQTIIIDNFRNNTGDIAFSNGHFYTDKAPGSSILAIPAYLFYKLVFVNMFRFPVDGPQGFHPLLMFLVICSTSALFSALTVVIVYRVSKYFLSSEKSRNITVIAYGIGTIAFSQATLFLGHSIAAFFIFYSFYLMLKSEKEQKDNYFLSGLFAGIAFFIDYLSIFAIFGCLLYILINKTTRHSRNVIKFFFGSIIFILILLSYNQLAFSDPLSFSLSNVDITNFFQPYLRLDESANTFLCNFIQQALTNIIFIPHTVEINYSYNYSGGYSLHANNDFDEYFNLINSTYDGANLSKEMYWLNFYHLKKGDFYEKILLENFNKSFKNFSIYYSKDQVKWELFGYYYETNNESVLIDSKGNSQFKTTCPTYLILRDPSYLINFSQLKSCYNQLRVLNTDEFVFEQYEDLNVTVLKSSNETISLSIKRKPHLNNLFDSITLTVFFNIVFRLLFYPFRGFFIYSPILILSFIGLLLMRKKEKQLSFIILLIFLFFLFFNASRGFWWAGTTFGPRYLLLSLPFLSIPLGIAIQKLNKKIVMPLLFLSILINFVGMQRLPFDQTAIFTKGVVIYNYEFFYRLYNWKPIANPLLSYYLPEFLYYGPQSVLIEEVLGFRLFPFLNILILTALLFIIKPFKGN